MKRVIGGIVAGLLAIAGAAAADTMKCGRQRITNGDSKAKVLQACGEPLLREVVSGGAGAESVRTEQWIYDRGKGQFRAMLTFEGLGLVRIEFLTRE